MSDFEDFEMMLNGFRLTTAEITYHLPDYPDLLNLFIWQTLDLPPDYPRIQKFLKFWQLKIEGRLHSVRVMHAGILQPATWSHRDFELKLH